MFLHKLKKSSKKPEENSDQTTILKNCLLGIGRSNHLRLYMSFALIFLNIISNVAAPLFLRSSIEDFHNDHSQFFLFILLYSFLWCYSQISEQLREIFFFKPAERLTRILGEEIFKSALQKESPQIDESSYLNALIKCQFSIPALLSSLLFFVLPVCVEIISVVTVIYFFFTSKVALLFILIILCYGGISFFSLRKYGDLYEKLNKETERTYSYLSDRLKNILLIKYNAMEECEARYFQKQLKNLEKKRVAKSMFFEKSRLFQGILIGFCMIISMCYMGYGVESGEFSIGDLVLINAYLIQFASPLSMLSHILKDVSDGLGDLNYIKKFLVLSKKDMLMKKEVTTRDFHSDIVFDNVSFYYNQDVPVLKNLSLKIPSGKICVIAGNNGAGKTTLVNLLTRIYRPINGSIRMGNIDLKDICRKSYLDHVSIVEQRPMMLKDTIENNLTYGAKGKKNSVDGPNFIKNIIKKLPLKEKTFLDEGQSYCSGGEIKILALQRALNKNPCLMILDEPTENLDVISKKALWSFIKELDLVTRVVITHDEGLRNECDHLIVIEKGSVIYEGPPKDYP
jgi:ATP-binding cassette subfamily B protein